MVSVYTRATSFTNVFVRNVAVVRLPLLLGTEAC